MIINSKKQSIQTIKQLNLNRCPEIVANKENLQAVINFFDTYKAPVYVLRDVTKPKGNFYFISGYEEFLEKYPEYEGDFSLAVSLKSFKGKLLVGDVLVSSDGSVSITCRTDEDATHRNIYTEPQYNLKTTMESRALWEIPHMEELMDFITKHNLYDVIVEFSIYSNNYGTNNENIIITELRTGY